MEDRGEVGSICKPPLSSPSNGKLPSGAVDYDVSLDRESDQQEWSFTLYDFDGHRRVTREDLSSVLKSISEALSASVTLPPCGSKKFHLRLSVMPDKDTDDQEKKAAIITPLQEKDAIDGTTKVLTPDSSKPSKTEPATTPTNNVNSTTHVHRRHHHHHHRRGDGIRSSKRHSRIHQEDGGGDHGVRSPDKRHSRTRKHKSSHNKETETGAQPAAVAVDHPAVESTSKPEKSNSNSNSNSNGTKEPSSPETPCTVIINELTAENLANHDNQKRKSDENCERRTYYQELAGIENTESNEEEQVVLTPAQVVKAKHERTRSKHHRNGHGSPHCHRRSKIYEIDLPLNQIERTAITVDKSKRTNDNYHMQLLEASKAKLENQQPVVPMAATPAPMAASPLTPEDGIADIGAIVMHRKEQRRRPHHNGTKSKRPTTLQPFMLFEHEVTQSRDRQVFTSPTLHRHDHHHHHEHHHHYHYHHYHT